MKWKNNVPERCQDSKRQLWCHSLAYWGLEGLFSQAEQINTHTHTSGDYTTYIRISELCTAQSISQSVRNIHTCGHDSKDGRQNPSSRCEKASLHSPPCKQHSRRSGFWLWSRRGGRWFQNRRAWSGLCRPAGCLRASRLGGWRHASPSDTAEPSRSAQWRTEKRF